MTLAGARRCAPLLTFLLGVASSLGPRLAAADGWDPSFSWGGFGTLGATYHSDPNLVFRRDITQPRGTNADEITFDTDSVFGLQGQVSFGPTLRVLAQVVSKLSPEGDWRPQASRAFLAYTPDQALEFRAGRIGFDAYPLAESPNVGYSYLPIRPAPEFFGLFNAEEFDGGDFRARRYWAGGVVTLRGFAGHTAGDNAPTLDTRVPVGTDNLGGQLDWARGPLLLRFALARVRVDHLADLSHIIGALRATGYPQAEAIADRFSSQSNVSHGVQFGIAYDGRPFQAQLLYTHIHTSMGVGPRVDDGLLTLGYRIGRFTPYFLCAVVRPYDDLPPTGLPEPPFDSLNDAVETLQASGQANQKSFSWGVRYDLSSHFDLKAQIDSISVHQSPLVFDHGIPTSLQPAHVTVFGVALDFVF